MRNQFINNFMKITVCNEDHQLVIIMSALSYVVVYFAVILTFCNHQISSLKEDYYWREYTGTISEDAIVGGKDINGENIYIGQAYLRNSGLIPVQIYPGMRQVYAAFYGSQTINRNIKILCGRQENFYWFPTTSKSYHFDLINKHDVIGGHYDDDVNGSRYYKIGRTLYDGAHKIGKISFYSHEEPILYFVNGKLEPRRELSMKSYEVLLYNKTEINIVS